MRVAVPFKNVLEKFKNILFLNSSRTNYLILFPNFMFPWKHKNFEPEFEKYQKKILCKEKVKKKKNQIHDTVV